MNPQLEQIKEAKKGNAILFGTNREIRRLPLYLHEGEIVYSILTGSPGKNRGRGIVVATNERILFIRDGWIFRDAQDFPYETFSSVEFRTGILFGTFVMYGKGDEKQYNWVGRFAGANFARKIRQISADVSRNRSQTSTGSVSTVSAAPAAPLSPEDAIIKQLGELGKLRDQGVISLDDFELKKQQLLDRL